MVCSAVRSVFVALWGAALADTFLGPSARNKVAKELVESLLLSELAGAGKDDRLAKVQHDLEPMFLALPKNPHGLLEHSVVRYALHRHFVAKYGWFVKGLDPAGGGWHHQQNAEMLKDWVPSYIQDVMERRLNGRGFDLTDLASFAATVEDLIHAEGIDDLKEVYQSFDLPLDMEVSDADLDIALRAFLAQITVGFGRKIRGKFEFERVEQEAREMYPEYDDIVMWSRDMHLTFRHLMMHTRNPFVVHGTVFHQAADFVKLWLHGFAGAFNPDCRIAKDQLLAMDSTNSGRVPLADFYANSELQFHESLDYLRNLAAVEERGTPRLIISNYVRSASRCLPFSGYYSVCCPDECEGLLGVVERVIAAPTAAPEVLARIVSGMSSDTVAAPRNLTISLVSRLHEIANLHGGQVPLYGRLFMQWMHHAFPHECPYPHESGTTKPVGQEEWLLMNDDIEDAMASDVDKARIIESLNAAGGHSEFDPIPWTFTEELVTSPHETRNSGKLLSLRSVMGLVAIGSLALPLVRLGRIVGAKSIDDKSTLV